MNRKVISVRTWRTPAVITNTKQYLQGRAFWLALCCNTKCYKQIGVISATSSMRRFEMELTFKNVKYSLQQMVVFAYTNKYLVEIIT